MRYLAMMMCRGAGNVTWTLDDGIRQEGGSKKDACRSAPKGILLILLYTLEAQLRTGGLYLLQTV